MINERERGVHQIFVCVSAVLVAAYALVVYGMFLLFYPGLNPAYWAYAVFILSMWLGLLIEGLTRPDEWRNSLGRRGRRQRRDVSQRQWLWMTVAVALLLVITRDSRISRAYIVLVILTAYPLFRALNHWGYLWFSRNLVSRSPHWRMRTLMVGPQDWLKDMDDNMHDLEDVIDNGISYVVNEESDFKHLENWLREREFDLLILPARQLPDALVAKLIALGDRKGYRVWLPVEFSRRYGRRFSLQRVGRIDILTPPGHPLANTFNRMAKRAFDIAVALPVIVFVLWPLMFFVWMLQIRNSQGPLFFRQKRMGENGKIFEVVKFRTMHTGNRHEAQQATRDDPRIYKGGGFLRKYSIDEFPQFLNVLRGEMSIVGPRPHLEEHEREFENYYARYGMRRLVKPGVTGLAQLHGYRGEIKKATDARVRARYDLIYLQNWCMTVDVKIIIGTAWQVIRPHKTAY